jgi:short-subunit dehydrogenase
LLASCSCTRMLALKKKVVVVTGAANGLGKALATEFYRQGCHLALIDIDLIGLEKIQTELEIPGQTISVHHADVSIEKNVIVARTQILQIHQHINILVNNAAISISQDFSKIDLADFRQVVEINFWGTICCSKHFLPDLKEQSDARLVNIISGFASMGFPGKTAYCSSKSAVSGFSNAIKTELADSTVKVCLVIPPALNTNLVKNNKHVNEEKKELEARFLEKNGLPLDVTAKRIVSGIRRGKYRIIIGNMMFASDVVARFFPTLLHRAMGKSKNKFDFL